ncbi:hypothetical protein BN874_1320012 [Candidatus Contendobacter odensis Run_B_J11]|uniref:Uncharacterized protein n=1 Tax=Candidatus Contendobacter odensis Run_B_J11 TaxID=1400861 RepID=A0A7U7G8X3_9GAMM|nr:hypothetical protein BN874_1320012 [Candidatus Contendobacter odensis Run_B_J11]
MGAETGSAASALELLASDVSVKDFQEHNAIPWQC